MDKPYIVAFKQWKSTFGSYARELEFRVNKTVMSESEFNEFYIAQKANGIDVVII